MKESPPGERPLLWPALGTVVFVLVIPGTVIGYIPFRLSGWQLQAPFFGLSVFRWLGAALFLGGLPVFADFLLQFVRKGRGTPAPIDPPRHLVVTGAFRYVRNPGYVGVISMIVGQGLFFGSAPTVGYAGVVGLMFHLFVVLYEEPDLRARFGEEYVAYCARVPRWIPRLTPARSAASAASADSST